MDLWHCYQLAAMLLPDRAHRKNAGCPVDLAERFGELGHPLAQIDSLVGLDAFHNSSCDSAPPLQGGLVVLEPAVPRQARHVHARGEAMSQTGMDPDGISVPNVTGRDRAT